MSDQYADTARPLKRRCAGCNRVIVGRPNKLYCSDSCQWAAQKRRQRADDLSGVSGAQMITRARRAGVINDVQIIGAHSDGLDRPPG